MLKRLDEVCSHHNHRININENPLGEGKNLHY